MGESKKQQRKAFFKKAVIDFLKVFSILVVIEVFSLSSLDIFTSDTANWLFQKAIATCFVTLIFGGLGHFWTIKKLEITFDLATLDGDKNEFSFSQEVGTVVLITKVEGRPEWLSDDDGVFELQFPDWVEVDTDIHESYIEIENAQVLIDIKKLIRNKKDYVKIKRKLRIPLVTVTDGKNSDFVKIEKVNAEFPLWKKFFFVKLNIKGIEITNNWRG